MKEAYKKYLEDFRDVEVKSLLAKELHRAGIGLSASAPIQKIAREINAVKNLSSSITSLQDIFKNINAFYKDSARDDSKRDAIVSQIQAHRFSSKEITELELSGERENILNNLKSLSFKLFPRNPHTLMGEKHNGNDVNFCKNGYVFQVEPLIVKQLKNHGNPYTRVPLTPEEQQKLRDQAELAEIDEKLNRLSIPHN